MKWALASLTRKLPLQFRVLYRQFLLRVIDLEALSIEADVTRLLGQMAGILILYGVLTMMGLLMDVGRVQLTPGGDMLALLWRTQHNFLSMTMLVAGLMAVISWDQIFPDRRDVMILGALPVRSLTILLAKIAAEIQGSSNPVRLEGHTDSQPIHNSRFRSNWELSAARSIAMLELLRQKFGIAPERMSVAGYAENAPVDSNATDEGRARNRRVDLVILSDEAAKSEPGAAGR